MPVGNDPCVVLDDAGTFRLSSSGSGLEASYGYPCLPDSSPDVTNFAYCANLNLPKGQDYTFGIVTIWFEIVAVVYYPAIVQKEGF